jgi:hypothetical protein
MRLSIPGVLIAVALMLCCGRAEAGPDYAGERVYVPVYPPYPYRAGHYPKADWYYDLPPYAAIVPRFYRKRFFMMAQERNRYRYMPHIFTGYNRDEGIDYGGDVDFNYEKLTETNGD